MAKLRLEHMYKVYDGRVKAVNDLNLIIDDKDFVVFVGPSGCGKSTTLRMIAGLEEISSGKLFIDDILVNEKAPKDRDIAMVFQNYALYPHKTVYDNMAFGLRLAGLDRNEIKQRIDRASDILELTPYLTRKPKALSGGQKQRVALGRSIVREPKVFLLDEPLSNLDAKLRVQMRSEISKLHRRLGTTFIYVTHDQVEAMTMGNRIVVMKDGYIQQIDSPTNLYDHPDNIFVATFLGTPQMNIYHGMLHQNQAKWHIAFSDHKSLTIPVAASIINKLISPTYLSKPIQFGFRPEDVYEVKNEQQPSFHMVVEIQEKRGSELIVFGTIEHTTLPITAKLDGRRLIQEGDIIKLAVTEERIHLFDAEHQHRIAEVITYNYFEGSLYPSQKNLKFANVMIDLPDSVHQKILPEYKEKDRSIGVRVPTDAFSTDKKNGFNVKLSGTIQSVEHDKNGGLVFLKIPSNDFLICVRMKKGHYVPVQSIDIYLDQSRIELFDQSFEERITTLHPIASNSTICDVVTKNDKSFAKFGQFTLELDDHFEPGKYQITIPYDGFEVVKDAASEQKHKVMRFKCVNESIQGSHTILYANLKEFPDYVSIKAAKDDTCFTKGKISFNITKLILSRMVE